jgi:outer membrane protein assembly factor BamA
MAEVMNNRFIAVIAVGFACLASLGFTAAPLHGQASAEQLSKKGGIIVLPIVFYSPETKLAGGMGGLLTFRRAGARAAVRPSSIYFYVIYTQLKQFSMSWEPEFYLRREDWLVKGRVLIERYPDKFWGIGPATPDAAEEGYTPRSVMIESTFQKKVVPSAALYAGLQVRYERRKIIKVDPGGAIGRGAIAGSEGGTATGIGFVLNRDSRDDVFFPHRGDYWLLSALFNTKAIGGDFAYTHVKLDGKKYLPLGATRVLAFHGQFQAISGTPPFYGYANLGSDTMMRGYYSGRYRDKVMAAVQAEYRMPLFWRIGIVGFAGLGNVAPLLGALSLDQLKYSVGTGLRFRVSPRESTNIRMDVAFGKGTSGVYFTAKEAF